MKLVRFALIATLLLSVSATAGCGGTQDKEPKPSPSAVEPPVDPMDEFTDPGAAYFLDENLEPYLHLTGTGATNQTLSAPPQRDLQFFITCAPDSTYTLTVDGMDTPKTAKCSRFFTEIIEVKTPAKAKELSVSLDVDADTRWFLVAIKPPNQ